jgi:hypothetical protein
MSKSIKIFAHGPQPLSFQCAILNRRKMLVVAVSVALLAVAVPVPSSAQPISTTRADPRHIDNFAGKPRVIIISDIGNEPDDQMSLVRLLLYSNELDIEALIATTSTWQRSLIHPETMHTLVAAYGLVRPNLLLHAQGWPEAEDLDRRIYPGQNAYAMAATGAGKSSPGSDAIVQAVERDDARPLWICLWGGANTLAQALMDIRSTHTPEDIEKLIARLRISSISDQDDAGPWIRREFPNLFYIVSPSTPTSADYYAATWTGISGDLYYRNGDGADFTTVTNEWLEANIRSKGPLGRVYPRFLFIMEGDTPSYLGLIDNGLNAYRRPDWGGWGGRYVYRQPYGETHSIWTQGGDEFLRTTSQDTVTGIDGKLHTSDQATIWRWRMAFQNDFAGRMSWTVSDFAHASHNPRVTVNDQPGTAPVEMDAEIGRPIVLDATRSTESNGRALHYQWFHYAEAGIADDNRSTITLVGADQPRAEITATAVCAPAWLPGLIPCKGDGVAHIILAVTNDGSPPMTSYRRIILHVHAGSATSPAAPAATPR